MEEVVGGHANLGVLVQMTTDAACPFASTQLDASGQAKQVLLGGGASVFTFVEFNRDDGGRRVGTIENLLASTSWVRREYHICSLTILTARRPLPFGGGSISIGPDGIVVRAP